MSSKETTKICPDCGSTTLLQLISMSMKICYDCGKELPWELDPGQKPLFEKTKPAN